MGRRRPLVLLLLLLSATAGFFVSLDTTPAVAAVECPSAPSGYNVITGATAFGDQIWGTSGADYVVGNDGNDVMKGLAGPDIICGGPGNDGLNGGKGDDQIYGEDGYDLLVGDDGNDTMFGGLNQTAYGDGLYGGNDADYLHGDDDDGTASATDYIIGGPNGSATDQLFSGSDPGDETFADTQSEPSGFCPTSASQFLGVYGIPGRLSIWDSANRCINVTGTITALSHAGDGDRTIDITILSGNT